MSDRERQAPEDFTYMWNLKNQRKGTKYKPETDSGAEKRLAVSGRKGWGMGEISKGDRRYKLPVIK